MKQTNHPLLRGAFPNLPSFAVLATPMKQASSGSTLPTAVQSADEFVTPYLPRG